MPVEIDKIDKIGDVRRVLLVTAGTMSVVLAILGIILPVLPTTPFLLLAAICYERSSPRFHNWLLNNRWFGAYIKNYREGRGIPLRQKVVTLVILWLTIGVGIVLLGFRWWLSLVLIGVATGVTVHLLRVKTFKPGAATDQKSDVSPQDVGVSG